MKHILVVSQYFCPENFRINDMAAEWASRGYKVTVLTGIPNYPAGKFYPGYSWTEKRRETMNGVDIIRIPLIARGRGPIGMVMNYLSFMVSGWFWNRVNKVDADLVFSFEVSPMTQVKVGCGYAKKHKVPHFIYVQDLWPENVETVTGIHSRAVIGPIDRMVDKIYRQADEIFVTSPSFVKAVTGRRHPVEESKVHYWPQYAEDFYRPLEKRSIAGVSDTDAFKIAFTGNIGTAQGLDVLPEAARLLKEENVRFIIVGDGRYKAEFERTMDQLGVRDKFVMIPRVAAERIPEILSACDAGFISFNKTALWEMTIPAKLQSYMACGKPIIASASGETKRIVEDAGCGVCTEIGDAAKLAEGIRSLMDQDLGALKARSRAYFEAHFEKKMLMDVMDSYMEQALSAGK